RLQPSWPSRGGGTRSFALLADLLDSRKERVGQGDRRHVVEVAVVGYLRIDEEADRHVDALARLEPLLGEAEALDLVEIGAGLDRRDVEGRGARDRHSRAIPRAVEDQLLLAQPDLDLALLRLERPGQ